MRSSAGSAHAHKEQQLAGASPHTARTVRPSRSRAAEPSGVKGGRQRTTRKQRGGKEQPSRDSDSLRGGRRLGLDLRPAWLGGSRWGDGD